MTRRVAKTKVRDRGYKRIVRDMKVVAKSFIETGFFQGQSNGSMFTVPNVAAVNEFGSTRSGIPERSFMRSTFDDRRVSYIAATRLELSNVLQGKVTASQAMDRLGIRFRDDIKLKITSIKQPPNAASTIAMKGFNNPLINTGTMRSRVTFKKTIR